MSHIIQLEAFESQVRSKHICWFLVPDYPITYPPGFQEQCYMDSPQFQRKILISNPASSEAWKMIDKWDAILHPVSGSDWSIILTVVLNQVKPCVVIFTPEVKAPLAFFQKLQQLDKKATSATSAAAYKTSLTLIQFQILTIPVPNPTVTYDALFFPPSVALEDSGVEATQSALQQYISIDILRNFVLKDAIRDLRSAGAALVVSKIDDVVPTLYWYYASKGKTEEKQLLSSIVQTLLLRN
jgi:hypothetical protein